MNLQRIARIAIACASVVRPIQLCAIVVSDSTAASRELAARVAIISAHQLETNLDTRLRLGLPMERLPDLSNAAAIAEGTWAREQLRELGRLKADGLTQEEQIASETLRYGTDLPGQALGSKIGVLEFLRLREKAKQELGPSFDIRAFHDVVLSSGSLPMTVLAWKVDQWIAAERARRN